MGDEIDRSNWNTISSAANARLEVAKKAFDKLISEKTVSEWEK
jgi:hypothetical protein